MGNFGRLNEVILIEPGDAPTIFFQVAQIDTSIPFSGQSPFEFTSSYTFLFSVFNNNTDLDNAAIFSVNQLSAQAKPLQGQMWFPVSIAQSGMLTRGVEYWFRAKFTDPGGNPFTAFSGKVVTGI